MTQLVQIFFFKDGFHSLVLTFKMAVIKGTTIINVGVVLMILYCCIFFVEDPSGDVCRAPGTKCNTESVSGYSRLKVNAGMERAVPDTDSSTCGQRGHSRCHPRGWRSPCSLVYFDANISRMVCAFTELCLGFSCSFSDQKEDFSRNNTKEKLGFGVATVVNNSIPSSGGAGFPYFPDLFRSFLYNHTFSHKIGRQEHGNVISVALYFIGIVIYIFMVLLALIHKDENYEAMKHTENTIILKFLCFKFSVKWRRNRIHWNQKHFLPRKFKRQCSYPDNIHQSSSTFFHDKNSVMNILNEHIFHPWRSRFRVENTESSSDNPGHTDCHCVKDSVFSEYHDCHCVKDSVFSECHEHYNFFFNPNLVTIQAYPVTRFLPNPTFNPDIDLSHVGYRLATLGALPSSVPVSRVRLADAGFYSRGHSEEVICYSCHVRVSDWSRGGDPMDIHRALSPHCEHVLARDRELAALVTGPNQGVPVNAAHNEGRQSHRSVLNAASENSHVEDSEGSEAGTSSLLPVPSQRSSSTGGSERPGMSMAASTPAISGFSSQTSRHASLISANEASQNSVTIPAENVMNNHTEVVKSSLMNSTNFSTSTSATSGNDTSTVRTNTASTNSGTVGTGSAPRVQTSSTASSSSVTVNSAGGGSHHLFPQSTLDLGLAVYPMYQSMSSRRHTFTSTWDNACTPPLEEVLMSGMFYAGYADCVRCFFCGVGLKSWERTDNVWVEHVRWRPHCGYLRTIKGDDFITAVQRQLGVLSPTREGQPIAQSSGQDQGSHNQGSSPPPTTASSSGISTTQVQPTPAAVLTTACSASFSATSVTSTPATTNSSTPVSVRTASVPTTSTPKPNTSVAASSGTAAVLTTSTATTSTSVAVSGRAALPTTSTATSSTSVAVSGGTASVPVASTTSTVNSSVSAPSRIAPVPRASHSGSMAAPATPVRAATTAALSSLASRVVDQIEVRREGGGDWRGGGRQGGVVHNEQAERDRLARLQEENRRLSQRLRCRLCHEAVIDTIIMPCGHLVVCATCATTVTSCPLCHFSVQATAHVFLDN